MSSAGAMATWCRQPDPVIGCSDRRIRAGAGWRVLDANVWEAADFPADGWGGQLNVGVPWWTLLLVHHAGGAETDRFELGRMLSLTIEITDVEAAGGEFAGFTEARTVGDAICSRLAAIYGAARAQLEAGAVQRCHYGHYTGDSSILCNPVPLPAKEAVEWVRALLDEESRHCEQARVDAPALAKLIRGLWPG